MSLHQPSRITFLNLPIGRGHPFYLEGIVEACNRSGNIGFVRAVENLFEVAPQPGKLGWHVVRSMYRLGSSPGALGRFYNRVRQQNDLNRGSAALSLLGAGLAPKVASFGTPVVISHPILIPILRSSCHLIYQHGEMVVPREALALGAELVIVPLESAAQQFESIGYRREQIFVSGLCIESAIARQARDAYEARLTRLTSNAPLTGAFFSSGAEPRDHVEKLMAAAQATVADEHHVVIFASAGKKLARIVQRTFAQLDHPFRIIEAASELPASLHGVTLVLHHNRREEVVLSSKLFPTFDFVVAPSHERSPWGLGLGLPFFILEPAKGSFAPLNRTLLVERGVAVSLGENHAWSLGARLDSLRNRGILHQMAAAGWQRHDINGFANIAAFLADRLAGSRA